MITLNIKGGPSFQVDFTEGMDIQDAIEAAYNKDPQPKQFDYSLQYYGSELGYLVGMINQTYDSFIAPVSYQPFFYWEISLNNTPITTGIDNTKVNDDDIIDFSYIQYVAETHKNSILAIKHDKKKFFLKI